MSSNPAIGVLLHWTGGLAAASFYLPYKAVKRWNWETYWLVGGFFSWIIAPAFFAGLLVPDTWSLIALAPRAALLWPFVFGLVWGIGGLSFGLTVRYLGLALGYALALGCCAAFGTLIPPIFNGTFSAILTTFGGRMTLLGVLICLVGIAISGFAGITKERELPDEQKRETVREFHFSKGLVIALFCGITSAAMAFALAAGQPLGEMARQALTTTGHSDIWQTLPVLVVVLWGGFVTNCIWCLALNWKNRSGHQYVQSHDATLQPSDEGQDELSDIHDDRGGVAVAIAVPTTVRTPMLANYLLCAAAGLIWYLQFFFYSMGATRMGAYGFSSWTLHMASIIIFSTLWGIGLHEWKGTSRRTRILLSAGLATLILSTVVVGYGNFVSDSSKEPASFIAPQPSDDQYAGLSQPSNAVVPITQQSNFSVPFISKSFPESLVTHEGACHANVS